MADNYLEKRMDDYRRGVSAPHHSGRRGLLFPAMAVFVYPADAPGGDVMLRTLAQAGYKVCFGVSDQANGSRLAVSTGGRYYPLKPEAVAADLARRGETVAALVMLGCDCRDTYAALAPARSIAVGVSQPGCVSVTGQTPLGAAILTAALAHPEVHL